MNLKPVSRGIGRLGLGVACWLSALAMLAPAAHAASLPLGDAANYSVLFSATNNHKLDLDHMVIAGNVNVGDGTKLNVTNTTVTGNIRAGNDLKIQDSTVTGNASAGDDSAVTVDQSTVTGDVGVGNQRQRQPLL